MPKRGVAISKLRRATNMPGDSTETPLMLLYCPDDGDIAQYFQDPHSLRPSGFPV